MTNNLMTFNFNSNQVRTEIINGEPWFSLLDCCKALGIKNASTSVKLPEAGVGKTYCGYESGKKEITIINEPNLYRLIFRSNKPQAQVFADWVYFKVLPSIRKTDGYGVPAQVDMKAIGGLVKKCTAVAIRNEVGRIVQDEVKAVIKDQFVNFVVKSFTMAEELKPLHEVSDDMLLRGLYNWYGTRHRKLLDTVKSVTEENGRLKSKLEIIKKTVN